MKKATPITHLLLDLGGVLLTNGWDRVGRKEAAEHFKLSFEEMEDRHRLTYDTYEEGKITLEDYLKRVVFYKRRSFSQADFWNYMCSQSKSYPEMMQLIHRLKKRYRLKIIVVSNEARELNAYRIKKFKLDDFVDTFISSCFVGLRKPDEEIFRLALDIGQAKLEGTLYIENTPMFVQVAEAMGLQSLLHKDYQTTLKKLALLGLKTDG